MGLLSAFHLTLRLGIRKNRGKMAKKGNPRSIQSISTILFPFPKAKAFLSPASLETQRSKGKNRTQETGTRSQEPEP
jgi:hypothetical protein